MQEVFFKIWKNKRFLNEELSFSSFIFTIAKNHIYNQLSKKISEAAYKHYCTDSIKGSVTSITEEGYFFKELQTSIQEKVGQMPEKRRKVFEMSRFEGQSNKEIAKRMGISLSTVENHLNKALKVLKEYLYIRDVNLCLALVFLYF